MQTQDLTSVSHRARSLDASKIRVVAEHGMKMNDVLPLWFGEGAWPTPTPIVDAAITALQSGVHRYQPNNGSPALREQVCLYSNQLFGSTLTPERVTVTPSGMQGLMLSAQLLVTPGDRVVMLEPGWPNIVFIRVYTAMLSMRPRSYPSLMITIELCP